MKMYFYFYFWIEHFPISIHDPHDPTTHILGNIFAYNKNNFIFWIIFKYPKIVKIPLEKKRRRRKTFENEIVFQGMILSHANQCSHDHS